MIQRLIKKYRSFPVVIRASFFFILSGLIKDAVDILTTPLFTRLLTQDEYGLFSIYNSYYQVIRVLASLYIFSDGFHVGMARFSEDRESFTSSMQGLTMALFVLWIAVFLAGQQYWIQITGLSGSLLIMMLVQSLFTTPLNCWQQKKKYLYDYRLTTVVIIIYLLLQPLAGFVLIRINPGNWNNGLLRIYGGVGIQILFGLVICICQYIRRPVFYHRRYWSFAIRTNIPLLPHYLSQILLNHSDRLMIDRFIGKAQTAIYSIGHAAAFTLFAFTSNLNSTFVPWLYERLKKRDVAGIRRIIGTLIIIVSLVTMGLVLIAPEAIMILGGEKYRESIWLVPPLSFSVFLTFVYSVFADFELFFGDNRYVLSASILGAVANIILNLVFIPRYGYVAAGYTTVAGYLLMSIAHYLFFRVTCGKNKLDTQELIPLPLFCLTTLGLAVMCGLFMKLYPYIVIRYILVFLFLILAVWKRSYLMNIFRQLRRKEQPGADQEQVPEKD